MDTNRWNSYCGCTEKITPCNTVFQKVDELPSLGDATRNHGYILPDNTVWVVNVDGTGFTQLNGGSVGTGGGSYDDTAIKERLAALEEKTDNDTIYDDSELRELIQDVADRNTMEDNRLVRIENKNAEQDAGLEALEDAIAELQNGPGTKTYTAGAGITISDDGVISSTVVDTDTDTDTRNTYNLTKSAKLNDAPKKLSEYGTVTTTTSSLLNNAIKVSLPDNVGDALNNVVLNLPLVNFDINVNGVTQHHEIRNVTTVAPWLYTKNLSSARGHVYVKTKFGVLKMEFDVSASSNKVVNFEFEFFKVADTSNGVITLDAQEPSLTVPMTIDNVMNGEAFGANFYDEYTITVTMEEPMMAVNSLDYKLTKGTEVIK